MKGKNYNFTTVIKKRKKNIKIRKGTLKNWEKQFRIIIKGKFEFPLFFHKISMDFKIRFSNENFNYINLKILIRSDRFVEFFYVQIWCFNIFTTLNINFTALWKIYSNFIFKYIELKKKCFSNFFSPYIM